jgi:hypothetical protein
MSLEEQSNPHAGWGMASIAIRVIRAPPERIRFIIILFDGTQAHSMRMKATTIAIVIK